MSAQTKTLRWWATIILLLVLAFGTRVWNLSSVPPGLTHDEASNGHDSAAILEGEHRIYFPVGYGHEPLYNYSVALTTRFLGQSIFTLRITTVAWGLAQCVLAAALARRWWGRRATAYVLAAYGASFWALMLSRVGLRAPVLPPLLTGSVLAYDHAIHPRTNGLGTGHRAWAWYALSGVLLGASLYTYMASRGMPLLYVVFLAALAIADRLTLRHVWMGTLALLLIALLVSAPLFIYLQANPELEQRIGQLGASIAALRRGNWQPIWTNISDSLPMLFSKADPQWLYNVAGRPGLEPFLAVLFVIGLSHSLADVSRLRDIEPQGFHPEQTRAESVRDESAQTEAIGPCLAALSEGSKARSQAFKLGKQITAHRSLLLLTWIAGGLAPALLTPVDYNLLHGIAALPPVMLTVALGATWLHTWTAQRLGDRLLRGAAVTIATLAFAATVGGTVHAYFVTWSENRNVHVAYHQHVVALGRFLDAQDDNTPVVMTSLYPGEYHDPYTMAVTLRREDLALRWADGRDAIFIPSKTSRLAVEAQTQPPAELWTWIKPDLVPLTTLRFRDDDIPTTVKISTWDAAASWARLSDSLSLNVRIQAGDPVPAAEHVETQTPINFADTVALIGYRWGETDSVHADTPRILLTTWEVKAATDLDLVIFAHLLTTEGTLIVQDDRIAAPSWQWQPGDRFSHLHRLDLPEGLTPGQYYIALGLYDRTTLARLDIHSQAGCTNPYATRLLLPLEVLEP